MPSFGMRTVVSCTIDSCLIAQLHEGLMSENQRCFSWVGALRSMTGVLRTGEM